MTIPTPPAGLWKSACRGVFLVSAALAVGCVSPRDIRVLQAQLDELRAEQGRMAARLASLDSVCVAGSSRDLVVSLKHSQGDLEARVAEIEARLVDLESRAPRPGDGGTPELVLPPATGGNAAETSGEGASAQALYETAFEALKQEDHTAAIAGFRAYLQASPAGAEAANAVYWIGESFFALGHDDSALVQYQSVVDRYPQSPKVPAALYKAGNIYQGRGDKEKAYPYFRRLKEEYPQSLEYQQLRRQLEE
jgi:tol-pal system protein YbgF